MRLKLNKIINVLSPNQISVAVPNIDSMTEPIAGNPQVLHATLGTSVEGLKYASAAWSTLAFEKPEEQITYNMDIMQHVFLYLVHRKTIQVMDPTEQIRPMDKYCKVSDTEMDVIKNPTENTVYVANKDKTLDDMRATVMTNVDRPFYLGVEFSGDGKRIFGHSEMSLGQLLNIPEGADEYSQGPLNQYIETYKADGQWKGDIIVPVTFTFGNLPEGSKYLIDEMYPAIRENPTPVSVTINIVFHRVPSTDGREFVGFSPAPYTSQLKGQ
jgi:hypothetical protein